MSIFWFVPTLFQESLDVVVNGNRDTFERQIASLSDKLNATECTDDVAILLREFVAPAFHALKEIHSSRSSLRVVALQA